MIQDDPAGAASWAGSVANMLDISSTPNLLLYSMLNNQVPSNVYVLRLIRCVETVLRLSQMCWD